jgi:hypothetical protein
MRSRHCKEFYGTMNTDIMGVGLKILCSLPEGNPQMIYYLNHPARA